MPLYVRDLAPTGGGALEAILAPPTCHTHRTLRSDSMGANTELFSVFPESHRWVLRVHYLLLVQNEQNSEKGDRMGQGEDSVGNNGLIVSESDSMGLSHWACEQMKSK